MSKPFMWTVVILLALIAAGVWVIACHYLFEFGWFDFMPRRYYDA